jgi:hypothetical protein
LLEDFQKPLIPWVKQQGDDAGPENRPPKRLEQKQKQQGDQDEKKQEGSLLQLGLVLALVFVVRFGQCCGSFLKLSNENGIN